MHTTNSLCLVSIWSLDGLCAGMLRGQKEKDVSSKRKLKNVKPNCFAMMSAKAESYKFVFLYLGGCFLNKLNAKCNVNAGSEKLLNEHCQHNKLVLALGYVTAAYLFAFRVVLHSFPSCFTNLVHNTRHAKVHNVTTISESLSLMYK